MRTWNLQHSQAPPGVPHDDSGPVPAYSLRERGFILMALEFLTRFPAAECVVTSPSMESWGALFDLFPKTLFHAFSSPLEDPPRPNVIRHFERFEGPVVSRFGLRGVPYNLIFCGDKAMQAQAEAYEQGRPSAALLWVASPVQEYLEGELVYPLHCDAGSAMCALVPCPGPARRAGYGQYHARMRHFQAASRYPQSTYDRDAEDAILLAYAAGMGGLAHGASVQLLVEMVRNGLPPADGPEYFFYIPLPLSYQSLDAPPQQSQEAPPPPAAITHDDLDLDALLAAAGVKFEF